MLAAFQTRSLAEIRQNSAAGGRIVESAVGAHLINETRRLQNYRLQYWNRDNREVDFVLTHGESVIAIEVKSIQGADAAKGLSAFKKEFPEAKALLVGNAISWQEILQTPIDQLVSSIA
jgi:predicted AAA+ superfamily ATPase